MVTAAAYCGIGDDERPICFTPAVARFVAITLGQILK